MKHTERSDLHQKITDTIVAAIEAGAGNYQMPWHNVGGAALQRPTNASSGKPYRGINVVMLWAACAEKGYASGNWATYKQWGELGAQVRKGERATTIVFYKQMDRIETADDGSETVHHGMLAQAYSVFNEAQVDGYVPKPSKHVPLSETERLVEAETFFANTGARIEHGPGGAYYQPSADMIHMPTFTSFRAPDLYYSVLGHETVHWTGGSAKRSERVLSQQKQEYAFEELVAELGAAFICADLAINAEPRTDHAQYCASWLKALKNDKKCIFQAASTAQKAVDFLHAQQPTELSEAA